MVVVAVPAIGAHVAIALEGSAAATITAAILTEPHRFGCDVVVMTSNALTFNARLLACAKADAARFFLTLVIVDVTVT